MWFRFESCWRLSGKKVHVTRWRAVKSKRRKRKLWQQTCCPNPKVSYGRFDQAGGRRNTQFDGPSQQNITVEVPMLLAGQRGARKECSRTPGRGGRS